MLQGNSTICGIIKLHMITGDIIVKGAVKYNMGSFLRRGLTI